MPGKFRHKMKIHPEDTGNNRWRHKYQGSHGKDLNNFILFDIDKTKCGVQQKEKAEMDIDLRRRSPSYCLG